VSEPPEQEEEEPAADADLEELLEQFREPEEPPKKRANPLWVISAILLSVLGVWLALRASGGRAEDKPETAALAGAMLPGKTSERLPRDEGPVDVVEDYLARCKKGMTAQEVRWIVEDFQRAVDPGIEIGAILGEAYDPKEGDSGFPALAPATKDRFELLLAELGRQQRAWYAATLVDGLQLSASQRSELNSRLNALLEEDLKNFRTAWIEYEKEVGKKGALPYYQMGIEGFFGEVVLPSDWLARDDYALWKLCDLSPEQQAVTRRSEVEQEEDQQADGPDKNVTWTSTWADRETPFRSSLAETREIHLADGEFGELAIAGGIFPLEEAQLFEGENFLRINDPTRLHPAQLKMLLLLEPGRAAEILQALEKADK
jgi:hypothetical protein